MIPAGLHFVYYSPVSKDGSIAPRRGFFHEFSPREVAIRRFNPHNEELLEEDSDEEISRLKSNLQNIDGNLGPYPYKSWKKWVSLSNRLTYSTVSRLLPTADPIISSSTEVSSSCTEDPPHSLNSHENRIMYTPVSKQKYPCNASPSDITKYSIDSSYQLQLFLSHVQAVEDVLVETQFSFLCFLLGQNYDSFCHWKQLVAMLCGCDEALLKYPQLFLNFITDLHFQMLEVPEDFFVDIVSSNNFLVSALTDLFANIREQDDSLNQLKMRAISFENHLTKRFGWTFSEDDEEFGPVVVND